MRVLAGWWLPAGGVDAGESFEEGAARESQEEACHDPELRGVLRIEHEVVSKGEPGAPSKQRMRVVYYAEPKAFKEGDGFDDTVKSEKDAESDGASWLSFREIIAAAVQRCADEGYVVNAYNQVCAAIQSLEGSAEFRPPPASDDKLLRLRRIRDVSFSGFPIEVAAAYAKSRCYSSKLAETACQWGRAIAEQPGCPLLSFGDEHWHLRASEPFDWALFLESGGHVMPLSFMQAESTPVDWLGANTPFTVAPVESALDSAIQA